MALEECLYCLGECIPIWRKPQQHIFIRICMKPAVILYFLQIAGERVRQNICCLRHRLLCGIVSN